MNIKALVGAGLAFAKKHQGAILTGVSMCAYGYSLYRAIKDSPKILEKLDELNEQEATTMEKAKAIAPEVAGIAVPFVVGGVSQLLCTKKLSDTVSSLANALTIGKVISDETNKAIEEEAGPEAAERIKERVAGKKAEYAYSGSMFDTEKIEVTGKGNDLIYFEDFDKWFFGSANYVEKVVNDANAKLNDGEPISANDFLSDIGLKRLPVLNKVGWHEYDDKIAITIGSDMNDDNRPYVVLSLKNSSRPHDLCGKRF